jgi:hypothetical protein
LFDKDGVGYLYEEIEIEVFQLEERRRKLFTDQQVAWRLKYKSLWLSRGDENIKLFH